MNLHEARDHLRVIVQDGGKASAEALARAIAELDRAAAMGLDGADAHFQHYLRNRSYSKALAWIEGEAPVEKGTCGGKHPHPRH